MALKSPAHLRLLAPVVLLCVVPLAVAQTAVPNELLGRWRSQKTSKGGIGALYEFRSSGVIEFSPAAIVDMDYRVEGNQLIFPSDTQGGAAQKQSLQWTGDSKFRLGIGTESEEYTRQGSIVDRARPILGEWTATRTMEGQRMTARFVFLASGKALFVMAFTTQHGTFTGTAGQLAATFPAQGNAAKGSLSGRFSISNGVPNLTRSGERVQQFVHY